MDAAQWPQGIGVSKAVEAPRPQASTEKKPRPQKEQAVNCPRCNSTNTKFCYYNNYSLSQPRYFCKSCRRYWTEGGTLRNVPVGGGSRKNKRSISTLASTTSSSSSSKKPLISDLTIPSFATLPSQNPKITHGSSQDLNLAFPPLSSNNYASFSNLVALQPNPTNMDFLKNGNSSSNKGWHTFMSMPTSGCNNPIYTSAGIPLHDFKPTLNFSLDGFDNQQNLFGNNIASGAQDASEKMFLPPLNDLNQVSRTNEFDQSRGQLQESQDNNSSGYWSGMLGGYSW